MSEKYEKRIIDKTRNTEEWSEFLQSAWDHLDQQTQARLEGFGGGKKFEPVPQFISAPCEEVISGENNTWIVLGRDRPRSVASGYGGDGSDGAGAIDICVGRASRQAKKSTKDGQPLSIDNDFKSDAARIYISQKTEIDKNFGLRPGFQGSPFPRSAIGMKADLVRIVARENIKLVTRTDDTNSQSGHIGTVGGIDLIAGNDDKDLQPLLKGNNVRELLFYMIKDMEAITNLIHDMALTQQTFEQALAAHTHTGLGVTPSFEVGIAVAIKSIKTLLQDYPSHVSSVINNILLRFEYLTPGVGKYICSDTNNTN
tara:strand:- start:25692 stop:26630 length:939 start_codon:yes stop_codon:yes gene_type:complete